MSPRPKFTSIDEYFASVSPDVLPILEEIRQLIKRTVPGAQETISYAMPAFKVKHVFLYFAAFKNHIGIYPPVAGDADLEQALHKYRGEKGNLKFPLDEPMPYDLIARVAETQARRLAR